MTTGPVLNGPPRNTTASTTPGGAGHGVGRVHAGGAPSVEGAHGVPVASGPLQDETRQREEERHADRALDPDVGLGTGEVPAEQRRDVVEEDHGGRERAQTGEAVESTTSHGGTCPQGARGAAVR